MTRADVLTFWAWRAADEACAGDAAQARSDALADAETLRLFMVDGRFFAGVIRCPGWFLGYMDLSSGARRYVRRGWCDRAAACASSAARAAFRAVPGLRPFLPVDAFATTSGPTAANPAQAPAGSSPAGAPSLEVDPS